jgi:hypothetical protein
MARPRMRLVPLSLAVIACLAISTPGIATQPTGSPPIGKISPAEATYQKLEGELVKQLGDEPVWTDTKQQETLMGTIRTAATIRAAATVPLLVMHIDFSPLEGKRRTRVPTLEEMFPAAGALVKIGTPAIPALLEVLKADYTKSREANKRAAIALSTLIRIDAQGAEGEMGKAYSLGKALTRYRIQMAIQEANPDSAARLKEVLKGRSLEPVSDLDFTLVQPDGSPPTLIPPKRLTGFGVGLKEAVLGADVIVAASAIKVSGHDSSIPGVGDGLANIEATKFLKGGTKETRFTVTFKVNFLPNREVQPNERGSYLFFVKGDKPENYETIKILDDTPDNRDAVIRAMNVAPGGPKKQG